MLMLSEAMWHKHVCHKQISRNQIMNYIVVVTVPVLGTDVVDCTVIVSSHLGVCMKMEYTLLAELLVFET